jgi:hypothetical protein
VHDLYLCAVMTAAFLSQTDAMLADLRWYLDALQSCPKTPKKRWSRSCIRIFRSTAIWVALGQGCQYGCRWKGRIHELKWPSTPRIISACWKYRHGPIATATDRTLAVAVCRGRAELEEPLLREVAALGARVAVVGSELSHTARTGVFRFPARNSQKRKRCMRPWCFRGSRTTGA